MVVFYTSVRRLYERSSSIRLVRFVSFLFLVWFGLACLVGSLLFFICLLYLSEAVVREVEFDQVGQVCLFVFNFFFVWLFHMVIFFT